jgi:hypothetical protein
MNQKNFNKEKKKKKKKIYPITQKIKRKVKEKKIIKHKV